MSEKFHKKNILIIAEGFEEKVYIDKILSFPNIRKDVYRFTQAVNVKGNGNILARYQYEVQRGFYDAILIFCDADKGSDAFLRLVSDIGTRFFRFPEDALKTFIFVNPVTLQVVLSHFGEVTLTKVSKAQNASFVYKLTGVENYAAEQSQIQAIVDQIHYGSLEAFKQRLSRLSTDPKDVPSTNFLAFLHRFESENDTWVDEINALRKAG